MNNFTRGQDPKEAMGIGRDAILKEIGGIILNDDGIAIWKTYWGAGLDPFDEEKKVSEYDFKKKNVIIGVSKGKYTILKNRFEYDGPSEGDEKDLITILLKLKEAFLKNDSFIFPMAQKIAARTIGWDLVSVKPMSGPVGKLYYYDSKKANKITILGRKILNKIRRKNPSIFQYGNS
jgi:hypothetical protein